MLCFVRQSSRSLGYRPNSLRLCRFGFPITLYSSHATALPIRVLVNTCQPDERMFDKSQRKVPAVDGVTFAIAPVETAGAWSANPDLRLADSPSIYLGLERSGHAKATSTTPAEGARWQVYDAFFACSCGPDSGSLGSHKENTAPCGR
jgi:hypothetical protein